LTVVPDVVITGLGAISSLGQDKQAFWSSLAAGRPGIRALSGDFPDTLKVKIGAQVENFNPKEHFSKAELPLLERHTQFALIAAREAIADAGLDEQQLSTAAAVIGTACGGQETNEIGYRQLFLEGRRRIHPLTIPRAMASAASSQVSMQLGIAGPAFTVTSACSSANHAIIQAAMMIRAGLVDVAVAGGAEAPFTYGLLKAWEALRVLSNDTCRPFSSDRSGLVLGEGAGVVVLESQSHANARGARILAELAGCGMSADAGHVTDPSVDGAMRAMTAALSDAGLEPAAVDYVSAHGTATRANDVAETAALHQLFGEHAQRLAVSSTKSMHGHALGAAGALELVATVLAMRHSLIPPTANFTTPGEGCDLDYVPNTPREMAISVALSNSFAFGGLNAVLVVRSVS